MDWPCLDPRGWNLSLRDAAAAAIAAAISACGPVVTPEGETDPTGGECIDASDCPAGYYCAGQVCAPYYDYDYECLAAGSGGCCGSDCYYYECYADADCGPSALCTSSHDCLAITSLPECEGGLSVVPLELPQSAEPFVSLAFVDANGDPADDLVVGRTGLAELYLGPGDAAPVALPIPPGASVTDAAAGDFDGDGAADLVLSTLEGRLVTLTGDGAGGFVLAADQDVMSLSQDLTALQWDGDGALDLAVVSSGVDAPSMAMVHLGDGAGGFMGSATLATGGDAVSLSGLDYDGTDYGDVAVQDLLTGQIFAGGLAGDVTADAILPADAPVGLRMLRAGPIDSVSPDEVVGYAPQDVGRELVVWPNVSGVPQYYQLVDAGPRAELGDFDGDGSSDVVFGDTGHLTYVRGALTGPLSFSCRSTYLSGTPLGAMAMGDLDGNGRVDVAVEANGPVLVLLSQ